MKMESALFLLVVTIAVAACASSPGQRSSAYQDDFDALAVDKQQRLRAGEVAIGDTPWMVEIALGRPDAVATRETDEKQETVWRYFKTSPRLSIGLGGGSGNVGGGVGVGSGGDRQTTHLIVFRDGKVATYEATASD